jgi:hypothetical protein
MQAGKHPLNIYPAYPAELAFLYDILSIHNIAVPLHQPLI